MRTHLGGVASALAWLVFPLVPAILGRDVSGIVRELGPGVSGFKPGDKVMALGWKTYAELTVVAARLNAASAWASAPRAATPTSWRGRYSPAWASSPTVTWPS